DAAGDPVGGGTPRYPGTAGGRTGPAGRASGRRRAARPRPSPARAHVGDGRARGDELRPRSRLRVEPVEVREQKSAALARGLGEEIIGEPGRTEDAEDCAGGVVSGRGQQITDVFEPAQLCGARPPDSTLR